MNPDLSDFFAMLRQHDVHAVWITDESLDDITNAEWAIKARHIEFAVVELPEKEDWRGFTSTPVGFVGCADILTLVTLCNYPAIEELGISISKLTALPAEIGRLTNLTSLNLSYNKLTALPAEITQLTHLTSLDLSANQLTALPAEIGQLTNLTSLELQHNGLTSLPAEITQLTHLTSLDLSFNPLAALPTEITQLTQLTSLDLRGNRFIALPAEIARLTHLTSLNLSANQLTALPTEITQLTHLSSLGLRGNQLTALPAEISQLTSLTSLNLSYNKLTALPAEITQLTHLMSLDLRGNRLTTLPAEITQLTSLTSLDLSANQLTALPAEISQLTSLTSLSLSSSQLTALLAEITHLTHLTSLSLPFSQLTALPAEITQLTQLTTLDLSFNQLTALPAEITQLTDLTSLDLSSNRLTALPAEITQLTHLTTLYLRGNQLTALPAEITRLTDLMSLDLSSNQLTALPAAITRLTDLTSLDLSSNQLIALLAEITQLTHLTSLNISANQFTALPAEIARLTNLTWLDVSANQLTALPAEITQLTHLTSLNLSANQLTALPVEITRLTKLSTLDLSVNQLTALPAEIARLTNLTWLDVSANQLTALPAEITQLTNLWLLYLQRNQLTALPVEITQLTNLTTLNLRGNQLDLPPEILDKGEREAQSILNYYAWIIHGKRKPLGETKLLVVGQGSVGKTSLVRRLIQGDFDPGETKTEGIAINRWTVATEPLAADPQPELNRQPVTIQVNIWDFGGQEIMHATHQFFLTKRSLYLLVLDARLTQEENRVEYWLKIIQSFGGDSPVLIVGNKTDQHPLDLDRTGLQKKYPSIVGILEASAATGVGIAPLKTAIATQVNALPHVRDLLPEPWFTVKNRLAALGHAQNFIAYDAYLALCSENAVSDEISQRTLLGLLHDLGVILHFQDDPRLEALGILTPQWVTNGVYKILNSHALFQNKGVLTLALLDHILDAPEYPRGKRLFIVDMMRKFELCYDIEPNQTFLVPDLLPKDEPFTGEWAEALAFQFHYTVLPTSIISRFIVRMSAFVHQPTTWRSGTVLKRGGNTALVKADIEDRKIFIWVAGDEPTRRDLLSAIRAQFEAIHRTIAKIEVREKVPVPTHPDVVVDYEHLLKLERKGVSAFIPEGLDDPVSVQQLLDGVTPPNDRQRAGVPLRQFERDTAPIQPSAPPAPVQPVVLPAPPAVPAKRKHWLLRILIAVFNALFLHLPRIIGRVITDLVGRDKAADSTARIVGYLTIVLGVLLILGVLDFNALVNTAKDIWRFFFPSTKP